MSEDKLAFRRKIFHWIATIGLGVFVVFLVFIFVSLYACGPADFTTR